VNREELVALRDAIDLTLALPDSIREQVARWLTPEAAKPNGRDPHPPVLALGSRPAKARRDKPFNAQTAERRLLTAMQESPGSSVVELARAAGRGRSVAGERFANWRSAE
jgi:hypothetical protein